MKNKNNPDLQSRPKPFSKERTKMIVSRIIYFYSIFFIIVKVLSLFQGAPFIASIVLILPFIVLAIIGFRMEKTKIYSWIYIIAGIVFISFIRFYELEIVSWLNLNF